MSGSSDSDRRTHFFLLAGAPFVLPVGLAPGVLVLRVAAAAAAAYDLPLCMFLVLRLLLLLLFERRRLPLLPLLLPPLVAG